MNILLAGAGGMLGTALATALPAEFPGCRIVPAGRAALGAFHQDGIAALVEASDAALVVNAAAHTDVEGAEGDPDAAFAANAELPFQLAQACRKRGIPLIHVSSTGCYGAWKDTPYTDYDDVRPTTVHHRSKIAGEEMVRATTPDHLIVRTGWLFGGDARLPKNFVFRRILEASRVDFMRSDPTQRGNPTSAGELATAIITAFACNVRGTCNIVSAGNATRLDYVREIVRLAGLPCQVEASEGAFSRRATVSPNEAAEMMRLRILGLPVMAPWQEQLARYVAWLRTSPDWPATTHA